MLKGDELIVDVRLRDECRAILAKPRGPLRGSLGAEVFRGCSLIVAVGDRVSASMVEAGVEPDVAIVDMMEKREKVDLPALLLGRRVIETGNPAGTITREAWRSVKDAIASAIGGERVTVLVDGEEDLLGFPAVILSPTDAAVVYGQPGRGAVVVRVDEGRRAEAVELLERCFEPCGHQGGLEC